MEFSYLYYEEKLTYKEISELTGRSIYSIRGIVHNYLKSNRSVAYSENEFEEIEKMFLQGYDSKQIAFKFNRSVLAINTQLRKKGKYKTSNRSSLIYPNTYKLYSIEEDNFIIQNADKMTVKEVGKKLGRTVNSVWNRSNKLRKKGIEIKFVRKSNRDFVNWLYI